MTREEAIEVYNGLINTKIKEAFEFFAPELRESGDERIRKELVAFFIEVQNREGKEGYWHDLEVGHILAYLEKQKEQKPVDYDAELKKCKDNPLYFYDKYVKIKLKPAEWSTNDKAFIKDCAHILDENGYAESAERLLSMFPVKPAESRKRNKPKESWLSKAKYELEHADELLIKRQEELGEIRELKDKEQKPAETETIISCNGHCEECSCFNAGRKYEQEENNSAEWSEDEEQMFGNILNHYSLIEAPTDGNGISKERYLAFIKSLRPVKTEWSEEDKKMIDTIVSVLGQYIDYKAVSGTGSGYATPRYSKEIAWLKSLRPPKDCSGCSKHLQGYIDGRGDAENKLLEMYGILLIPDGELRMKPRWRPSEEDERMRRMLIDRLRSAEELTDELREWILSYLEKHKEL